MARGGYPILNFNWLWKGSRGRVLRTHS
jgi:hypothetical protein